MPYYNGVQVREVQDVTPAMTGQDRCITAGVEPGLLELTGLRQCRYQGAAARHASISTGYNLFLWHLFACSHINWRSCAPPFPSVRGDPVT
jgi:hypothetical protein